MGVYSLRCCPHWPAKVSGARDFFGLHLGCKPPCKDVSDTPWARTPLLQQPRQVRLAHVAAHAGLAAGDEVVGAGGVLHWGGGGSFLWRLRQMVQFAGLCS